MQQFRTMRRWVQILVALFFVAQFAGVVASPLAGAQANARPTASFVHHHQAHHDDGAAPADHDGDKGTHHHADYCCALHAFFVGVIPAAVAIETAAVVGEPLAAHLSNIGPATDQSRLDRPPRPFAAI